MRRTALTMLGLLAAPLGAAAQSSLAEVRDELRGLPDGPRASELADAADRGLAFLAARQDPRGFWTGHVGHKREDDYMVFVDAGDQRARGQGHVGVTSLAALAFLAQGNLPARGRHREVVRRALDYVLTTVRENGFATDSGTRMYSHAFATLFLAQVYGMVGEARVKVGLEHAVHWIVDCQNHQGGWRYNPFSREADMSVTVCQLQALRAARNIGIRVPKATIDRAVDYVLRGRANGGSGRGLYYYKTEGRGAFRKNRQFAINAAALTSLYSAGVYDRELVDPALAFLQEEYDFVARYYRRHFYYWYGNYYASQAFFQAGGDRFERYYRRVSTDLLEDQRPDGRWVNDVGPGDVLSTAVATLILLIPHQYLPIFQR